MNTTHVKALVTGANGYLAGWIIKSLISRGIHVHTTVRQLDDQKKYHHLLSLKNSNQIKFFEANLLDRNSFKDAIQGCSIVFHTASPVALNAKNPMKDLLEPAKIGTANILHQVNQTTSVKKVILTSSTAAMCGFIEE